jgi:hypothetical protein
MMPPRLQRQPDDAKEVQRGDLKLTGTTSSIVSRHLHPTNHDAIFFFFFFSFFLTNHLLAAAPDPRPP